MLSQIGQRPCCENHQKLWIIKLILAMTAVLLLIFFFLNGNFQTLSHVAMKITQNDEFAHVIVFWLWKLPKIYECLNVAFWPWPRSIFMVKNGPVAKKHTEIWWIYTFRVFWPWPRACCRKSKRSISSVWVIFAKSWWLLKIHIFVAILTTRPRLCPTFENS